MMERSGSGYQLRRCPICKGPYRPTTMIKCNECKRMIHFECTGDPAPHLITDKSWKCPNCIYRLGTPAQTANTSLGAATNVANASVAQPPNLSHSAAAVTSSTTHRTMSAHEKLNSLIHENLLQLSSEETNPLPSMQNLSHSVTRQPTMNTVQIESQSAPITVPSPKPHSNNQVVVFDLEHQSDHESRRSQKREQLESMLQTNRSRQALLAQQLKLLDEEQEYLRQLALNDDMSDSSSGISQGHVSPLPTAGMGYKQVTNPQSQTAPQATMPTNPAPLLPRHTNQGEPPATQHSTPQRPITEPVQFQSTMYGATNMSMDGPTATQIASRQILGNLPEFSGNPIEYPSFISSYRESTTACGYTANENLMRLKKCLKGDAAKFVSSLLTRAENVPTILERLQQFFGKPELIVNEIIKRVRSLPPPKPHKFDTLIQYAIEVENLAATLDDPDLENYRRDPTLLFELKGKLPHDLQISWAEYVTNTNDGSDVAAFGRWLYQRASNFFSAFPNSLPHNEPKQNSQKRREVVGYHEENNSPASMQSTCLCCNENCPKVSDCNQFKESDLAKRWDYVRTLKLCRRCLKRHSFARPCLYPVECTFGNCANDKKHHPLLHYEKKNTDRVEPNNTHSSGNHETLFRYLPVMLEHNGKQKMVTAFLDEGSSTSLLSHDIAKELGVEGRKRPLCLSWTDSSVHRREDDSEEVTLSISSIRQPERKFKMNVRTISALSLPNQTLDYEALATTYPHLRNLPVDSYTDAKPKLLIGLNNWRLAVPLKIKEGNGNSPIGIKSRLGWTVFAMKNDTNNEGVHFHESCDSHHCSNEELSALVKSYCSIDSLGVRPDPDALSTQEELRAKLLMEKTATRIGDRFEIGLLWKHEHVKLPDSRPMALKRLECLERSLQKTPELVAEINKQIIEYQELGFIRKLSTTERQQRSEKTWYLPMFPVQNPNKPGKVRMVWDFAAKVNGISLNDVLLSGPDLTASLLAVLFRFRQGRVAIAGDIRQMFHQAFIIKEDQDAQRFLWRGGNLNAEVDEYIVTVMTFGATCSPSCAQYIKNTNAKDFSAQFPDAYKAIVDNHYVDDWLQSFKSEEEAIRVAKEVKYVHEKGGFEIRGWKSNSTGVLEALGEIDPTTAHEMPQEVKLEKVLGLWWEPSTDSFTFSLRFLKGSKEVLSGQRMPTKREVLRILMSVYDPLGLLSHFLVHLKILQQNLWRCKIDWDDEIPEEYHNDFKTWLKVLPQIENLRIPRYYECDSGDLIDLSDTTIQLHVFCDAGANAMATAAYFRIEKHGTVHCVLVAAKTHVAPLQLVSIPRLELNAAVMGARLGTTIKMSHTLNIQRTVYWSDSKTVLFWIHSNEARKYGKYVAFRGAEINKHSDPTQWRYVPSGKNSSDQATKLENSPSLDINDDWFQGPDFLYEDECNWPVWERDPKLREGELTAEELINVHIECDEVIDFQRFSSWRQIRRTMATVFYWRTRIHQKKEDKSRPKVISPKDYKNAEAHIFRQVQNEAYAREIEALRETDHDKTLKILKKSPLLKLSPFIDIDGVLKIRGRIDAAPNVPESMKHPVILPKNHHVTRLIVQHYHDRQHHIQHATVVNELRQRYYIHHVRVLVNEIKTNCVTCKTRNPKIEEPELGQLPKGRVTPFVAPFTDTGVDVLGPFNVTVKRSTEKRYVMLFTCLSTRAVHTEVISSLNTDACMVALRTFMLVRGQPRRFYSDNGTNFVASEKLLREAWSTIDQHEIARRCAEDEIEWIFNPPASPHMGGAWERLVRSLKRAIYAILPDRNFTEASLRACLAEATYMVNMRPLTYISINDESDECITPNHFLIGSSNGVKPVGELPNDDCLMKYQYLTMQQFRNRLWKRWVSSYLPDLVTRSKNFIAVDPLKVDDIVVICDPNMPANTWPKGRITQVIEGKDGQVRSAMVQTVNGIYHRPATKLAKIGVSAADPTSESGEGATPSRPGEC